MTAKKFLLPLLAGGLALALTACGGPAPTQAPTAPEASATGTPTETTPTEAPEAGWDINETPVDQLVDGGELVGSIGYPITTWNVNNTSGNENELNNLTAPIRPAFFDFNASGDPVANPDYLESFTEDVVDGKLTVTLKQNPKAVWNDGSPIDIEDWQATATALAGAKDYSVPSTEGWDQLESVEQGADASEIKLTFKATYPDWSAIVSGGPIRAEGAADADTFNDGWAEFNNDWFSGPFAVTNWDKAAGVVTMERNPVWWGATPKLEKLTWKLVTPDAIAGAFANDEVDFFDIGPDPDAYMRATEAQKSVVRVAGGPNFRHFTFNSKSELLSDVNVRQAIMMGIDRGAIARSDLAGLPGDLVPLNNNIFIEAQTGFVDLAAETGIDYDPAGAKAKLEGAGWTMGSNGYYEKDGKELKINFSVLGGVKVSENEGLLAQNNLKEIGVNLNLVTVDTQTNWPGVLVNYEFDIIAFSWIGTPYPMRGIDQIYGGTEENGEFVAGDSNFAQLEIAKVQELVPQIAVEMDHAKRLSMTQEAAKAIWEAGHTLPLYQRPMLIGVRDNIANYGAFGLGSVRWTEVGLTAAS